MLRYQVSNISSVKCQTSPRMLKLVEYVESWVSKKSCWKDAFYFFMVIKIQSGKYTCKYSVPSRLGCMGWSDDILFNQPVWGLGFPRNCAKIESYESIAESVQCVQWSQLFTKSLHINLLQNWTTGTWQRSTFSKNFNSVFPLQKVFNLGKRIWFRISLDIRIRKSENPLLSNALSKTF